MKQNKDREEFEKKFKTIWVKSSGSQIGLNPAIGEECALVKLDEVWSYFQSYTKKKVEEAYKKGISDVEKNIEYNAQTKVWEIPEEKLLSIQSNKKRNKREIKTNMKYEFTRKEIIERKRNADYNAYELDYIQKQINAVKKQQVEGKITPQQAQKRIDSLNRWLHEQNWKCEKLEKLLIPNQ